MSSTASDPGSCAADIVALFAKHDLHELRMLSSSSTTRILVLPMFVIPFVQNASATCERTAEHRDFKFGRRESSLPSPIHAEKDPMARPICQASKHGVPLRNAYGRLCKTWSCTNQLQPSPLHFIIKEWTGFRSSQSAMIVLLLFLRASRLCVIGWRIA